jgi:hypothetical protein
MRETLVIELDEYLTAVSADAELAAGYMIEQLETQADELGIEDIVSRLEEAGSVDGPLLESLEAEMESDEEFEFMGEQCVGLLDRICSGVEWVDDEVLSNDDDDEF